MKLKQALSIGKECGLETVGEAYQNIIMHSMNIFPYSMIALEELELSSSIRAASFKVFGLDLDDFLAITIEVALDCLEGLEEPW